MPDTRGGAWAIILRTFGAVKHFMMRMNNLISIYSYYFKPIVTHFLCNIFVEHKERAHETGVECRCDRVRVNDKFFTGV